MKTIIALLAAAALAGCGLETASTAATAPPSRKRKSKQGKKTIGAGQQKIGQAMEQAGQRAQRPADAAEK